MKVLIVGSGGREHALAWKIRQSPLVDEVYCAPGNAGIAQLAECVDIAATDVEKLLRFAKAERIGLTVPGSEESLSAGLTDLFENAGLKVCGPTKAAAELESSKVFAKKLMRKHGIPTAEFRIFVEPEGAREYAKGIGAPLVVKADGLAKGKGVMVCATADEAMEAIDRVMVRKEFGDAGKRLIIEECLAGEEVSILALTDGRALVPLPTSQDHKAAYDGDKGPNTGGMGAYSPAPVVTEELAARIEEEILIPTIHAMRVERRPFKGVLYAGLMITKRGPQVLEYNVRFGDPEAQPLFMRIKGDLVPILLGVAEGKLESSTVEWDERAAVCVVMASGGYPGSYEKGIEIAGLEKASEMEGVMVFHAGTASRDGAFITNGGRVLGVTALGADIESAIHRAYEAVGVIHFDGAHFRKDIGAKALERLS